MHQGEVGENVFRGVNLIITRRQGREVRLKFFFTAGVRHQLPDFIGEQGALFFLGADERRAARKLLHRFVEKQQQQRILETVPQLVARAERVGKRVEREQLQMLGVLNLRGEVANNRGVVQVATL